VVLLGYVDTFMGEDKASGWVFGVVDRIVESGVVVVGEGEGKEPELRFLLLVHSAGELSELENLSSVYGSLE